MKKKKIETVNKIPHVDDTLKWQGTHTRFDYLIVDLDFGFSMYRSPEAVKTFDK